MYIAPAYTVTRRRVTIDDGEPVTEFDVMGTDGFVRVALTHGAAADAVRVLRVDRGYEYVAPVYAPGVHTGTWRFLWGVAARVRLPGGRWHAVTLYVIAHTARDARRFVTARLRADYPGSRVIIVDWQ